MIPRLFLCWNHPSFRALHAAQPTDRIHFQETGQVAWLRVERAMVERKFRPHDRQALLQVVGSESVTPSAPVTPSHPLCHSCYLVAGDWFGVTGYRMVLNGDRASRARVQEGSFLALTLA